MTFNKTGPLSYRLLHVRKSKVILYKSATHLEEAVKEISLNDEDIVKNPGFIMTMDRKKPLQAQLPGKIDTNLNKKPHIDFTSEFCWKCSFSELEQHLLRVAESVLAWLLWCVSIFPLEMSASSVCHQTAWSVLKIYICSPKNRHWMIIFLIVTRPVIGCLWRENIPSLQ